MDGWKDAGQRTGGDGGSGRVLSSPRCAWVTSQEMLQPERGGGRGGEGGWIALPESL